MCPLLELLQVGFRALQGCLNTAVRHVLDYAFEIEAPGFIASVSAVENALYVAGNFEVSLFHSNSINSTFSIMASVSGLLNGSVSRFAIESMISSPSKTCPKTAYDPSRKSAPFSG